LNQSARVIFAWQVYNSLDYILVMGIPKPRRLSISVRLELRSRFGINLW